MSQTLLAKVIEDVKRLTDEERDALRRTLEQWPAEPPRQMTEDEFEEEMERPGSSRGRRDPAPIPRTTESRGSSRSRANHSPNRSSESGGRARHIAYQRQWRSSDVTDGS